MKTTEFSVLLVDDNQEFTDMISMDLDSWLDDKGFELKFYPYLGKAGVVEELKRTDIDLLIIDFSLQKETGNDVVQEIRENDFFQDVIFYTGGSMDALYEKNLAGVFYTNKENATHTIKEIINTKVKRFSDLATLRGWVVADAIEIEFILNEILMKHFDPKHDLFATQILERGVLDFNKKQMILNSMLSAELEQLANNNNNSERTRKLQQCRGILKSFELDIVHYRNALAHSKLDITADGIKRLKTLGGPLKHFDFTEQNLIQARKKFRQQYDNLITLKSLL